MDNKMREVFLEIWESREHFSELSQKSLGEEPLSWMFHHVMCKELYPEIKYEKWNIILVGFNEHENIHNSRYSEKYEKILNKVKEKYEDWKERSTKVDKKGE